MTPPAGAASEEPLLNWDPEGARKTGMPAIITAATTHKVKSSFARTCTSGGMFWNTNAIDFTGGMNLIQIDDAQ
jgi:hypothetical protein